MNGESDIYVLEADHAKPLSRASVKKYIEVICLKRRLNHLDVDKITDNVYPKLKRINTIQEIKDQIITSASEMITDHFDYPAIASWILIQNLHEETFDDYCAVVDKLRSNINKRGKAAPIVSEGFATYVKKHGNEINAALRYERDYDISIFGFRTLERAYLKKSPDGKLIERPQHLYMRVAIAIHYRSDRLDRIIETYNLLSEGYFVHATPTLFNAGTMFEQLSSCFLLGLEDDMASIGECWQYCGLISKYAGGIGINMTNVRMDGSYINSTQGLASGLRVLSVFNQIARYADQGGKRAGSIAVYIEPWHGDIFFFLDLKKTTGAETERARDLFLALMVNDIFMKRVEENGIWSLMCPSECPDLINKYGTEFTRIYEEYEAAGKFHKQIQARDLWFRIMESQIESGVPYIVFKDAVNYKSNQINIGVVNGSNLCVAGDTMILTSKGYVKISDKVDEKVKVWNGEEFSKVTIKKTGVDQEMLKIYFSNGSCLECTPYHKFYTTSGSKTKTICKRANELEIGDKLIKTSYPIIKEGVDDFKYPYTHGLFCADGTYGRSKINAKQCSFYPTEGEKYCKRHIKHHQIVDRNDITNKEKCHAMSYADHPLLALYGEKKDLKEHFDFAECGNFSKNHDKIVLGLYHDIETKFVVPINYNLDVKLKWLAGYLDGDGSVAINGSNKSLQAGSINKKFLNDIKYMLQTMGCDPKVTLNKKKGTRLLPDGKGNHKYYDTQRVYRILINSVDTYKLVELGLDTHRIDLNNIEKPQRCASHFITVTKVIPLEELADIFCFTEPKRHMGTFNGILIGNCSEILEVTSADEISCCNLNSICLPKYVDLTPVPSFNYHKLYEVARVATRN